MSNEEMKFLLDGVTKQLISIMETFARGMSDEEFGKIPTILMTKEEEMTIQRYGIVFYAIRGKAKDYLECRLYSCGGSPFKIKIKDQ